MGYFFDVFFCDLVDIYYNVLDGVYVVLIGGVWGCFVYGFVGMCNDWENLCFDLRFLV